MKSIAPRPRVLLGFSEEFWTVDPVSKRSTYAGHRTLLVGPDSPKLGTENATMLRLESDLTISRSFSRLRTLKAGVLVWKVVWPLQGREI